MITPVRMLPAVAFAWAGLLSSLAFGAAPEDAVAGRVMFEKRCASCHALEHEKEGPRLGGVVGRKAGSVASFPYSDALKKSSMVWNEAFLDKWLTDPQAVIPDTDMALRLDNARERAAIIEFLKGTAK